MMEFKHPIYGNEGLREMTAEEIERYSQPQPVYPVPQPSPEQRIAELEAQLAALTEGYAEGVNKA